MNEDLTTVAWRVARLLTDSGRKVVFAESCTAGLVSATLAQVPGASAWHCGSAVVYREATKTAWLGVSPDDLLAHTAVSEPVARQMAAGALERTPEADVALAVTGHLGPDAPEGLDGVIYLAAAWRRRKRTDIEARRIVLQSTDRLSRQVEATYRVFVCLAELLENTESER